MEKPELIYFSLPLLQLTGLPAGFLLSPLAGLTHLSPLLGTSGCAAGAARCGSQQPPASQQAQPGTWQAPGGHLELAKAPPG